MSVTFLSQLILLLWPLYQFSQFPLPSKLYLFDFLIPIVLLLQIKQIKKIKLTHPLLKPAVIFLSTAVLSLLIAAIFRSIPPLAPLYLIRLLLYFSLLLISFPKNSLKLLKISFFLVPILGILQYLILPDLRFLKFIGYDDHYFRLTFPFLDPNYSGAILAFIALYSIKEIKKNSNKILFVLSLIALALTFSRVSWLAFFVGLFYLAFKIYRLRLLALLSLLILGLFIFISPKPFGEGVNLRRSFSIYSRFHNYKIGWNLFSRNPFTGQGFNTLNTQTSAGPWPQRAAAGLDNSFLFVLATSGILGLLGFLFFLYRSARFIKDQFLLAAFLSLLIHSLANNTLFYAPISIICLLLLNLSEDN